MSPSDAMANTRKSHGSNSSAESLAESIFCARASPTTFPIPWPSGPVVVSTPGMHQRSG